ncbi:MAG: GDP-mannose 4,6-dehydratase [Bacteroidetes bacterium]|nr:GDP-mannose 4,6-dehydratase [Bacteroidota bacterium]
MTVLIFGSKGQDGYYLTKLLQQEGIEVIGFSRSDAVNLSDFSTIKQIIEKHKPAYIFHFAADSTTAHHAVLENHQSILTGAIHILESVKQVSPDTKVFLSGSGLQFENIGKPIKETDLFSLTSAYAMTRNQSVIAARYYRSLGLKVYIGYFFNHDSPLRTERHMSQKIISAVKRIASGANEKIEIGDIHVRKEWGFAGDIVKGVWTLVKQDHTMEAVIGTGKAYSIWQWVETCFSLIKKDPKNYLLEKKGFVSEYQTLVSDPTSIFSLGWRPEVSFEQLAEMMLLDKP